MPMFTVHSVAFGPTCHEKLSRTINSTEHQQLVHTLRTSCRSGWPRGFGEHEPSATVRRYQFTRRQSGRSLTIHFHHFQRFQVRRSFAPLQKSRHLKSRFLCVNKSLILYGFLVGATRKSYKSLSGIKRE